VNAISRPDDPREDELLAIRCQLGERAAFDALISRWHESLWRYLRRLSGSDDAAADLAQDTWLRVLRGITALRKPASLRAWLFGIARRVAMDRLRHEYVRRTESDIDLEALVADAERDVEADVATLDAAIAALPFAEREALTLFYLREFSIDELSALLEIPVGTAKSRLFRARRALRREIEKGALP